VAKDGKSEFKHESLQDGASIVAYLEALANGIRDQRLVLKNDNRELVLEPRGLLSLEVSAKAGASRSRVVIEVSWSEHDEDEPDGTLVIG
jgi:amphi-Trp domain-containing protein